ncbi:hypothetical protein QFZ51_002492 [Chitinophaga sp. W3I9]
MPQKERDRMYGKILNLNAFAFLFIFIFPAEDPNEREDLNA